MKLKTILGLSDTDEQEQAVPEFCLPKCRIGLEYEWENTGKYKHDPLAPGEGLGNSPHKQSILDIARYFDAHLDGSLRDHGQEFTFKEGYRGSKILRALSAMDSGSRALGFTGSYRTSLHVHVDMQDTNFPEDVELFGAVYCITETFLYQFVGNSRNVSNYCVPWYKHPQQFESFLRTLRKNFSPDGTSNFALLSSLQQGKGNKYSGLNCFSIGDFGTVEFRQAPVTLQKDKIILWLNLLMRIKEWVVNHPMSLIKFVDHCNTKPVDWLLHDIFQSHYSDVVRLSRHLEADFWNGMETLYQYVAV
jgi:hypothetical protein